MTTETRTPIYRNFELEVRTQRAEALTLLLLQAFQTVRGLFATRPATRGAEAMEIGRAWLKASA